MAGKVVNSIVVLLCKYVAGGQESALKTATSYIRKPLSLSVENPNSKMTLGKRVNLKLRNY
jgi:hypothetical protein